MFELKRLHPEAVPAALEKAERYRLLNEPIQAESICLDVLAIDADNQKALVVLLLALTDQFASAAPPELTRVRELLPRLADEYHRSYYAGLVAERRATALLERGGGARGHLAYDLFREAMACYERAGALAPAGDDDSILRWNTCVRLIERHPHVQPAPEDSHHPMLE